MCNAVHTLVGGSSRDTKVGMRTLVSRRSVLVSGVAAGGLLAAGGWVRWARKPAEGALVLSAPEIEVVEAATRVLFPPGVFPIAGGDGKTAPEVDRILAEVIDPRAVAPFRTMLGALEWGTLISRGSRFSELTPDEAKHVLDVWGSENPFPRRVAFDSLQAVIGMAFLRRPEVLKEIGWRTGCFG
jgi:hypothetical protein